jgi:hypothetical protein
MMERLQSFADLLFHGISMGIVLSGFKSIRPRSLSFLRNIDVSHGGDTMLTNLQISALLREF